MTATQYPDRDTDEHMSVGAGSDSENVERTVLIGALVIGVAISAILALVLGVLAGRNARAANSIVAGSNRRDKERRREQRRDVIQLAMALNRLLET